MQSAAQNRTSDARKRVGLLEAIGLSLAIIAPTLAMSFNVALAAQAAGPAAPLAFAIGTAAMLVVGFSFVLWSRRLTHAGSAYGFITAAFGKRWGFLAGWALLLTYITYGAGSGALVGNFIQAALPSHFARAPQLWLFLSGVGIVLATWLACRDMKLAGRTMLALEGISLLALITLAVIIVSKNASLGTLSLHAFVPSPSHNGWAGVGHAIVFAVLSFGGFEAAATLGEETDRPRRNIPIALFGTLLLAGALYVFICYAQVIGFGLNNSASLANDSVPLDTLAVRYVSRNYAVVLDLAAALGGFSCLLGSLSAAGRILYALGRAGLAPFAACLHERRGTPFNAILAAGALCLLGLLTWAPSAGAGPYYGATGTVGTLAIILVYMGVAGAQSAAASGPRSPLFKTAGIAAVLLLLWPLYNSIYPIPAYPDFLWPLVLVAWMGCGALLLLLRPALAREDIADLLEVNTTP